MTSPSPALATVLDAALRGALLALLALLGVALMRGVPLLLRTRVVPLAMALGLAIQVVGTTPALASDIAPGWAYLLDALSTGNATLFWLLVLTLVDDEFVARPWHGLVWLTVVAFIWSICEFRIGAGGPAMGRVESAIAPAFALLSAIAAVRHWRDDLVENRRRFRAFVVCAGIGDTLISVFVHARAPNGRVSTLEASLDVALLLGLVGAIAVRMLQPRTSELLPMRVSPETDRLEFAAAPEPSMARATAPVMDPAPRPTTESAPPAATAPDPVEERLAASLDHAMTVERAYQTEDLTVAVLAARLAVPEYRLRRLINQRLGHRNFNAYVNGFRLDDARRALADPQKRQIPILTIALEAGFQSIGPFNRAFKAATGATPGDYRREQLANR